MMATDVTRFPPQKWRSDPRHVEDRHRAREIASAFECSDWPGLASTISYRSPRRAHSFARNRPTGPDPTISIWMWSFLFTLFSSNVSRYSDPSYHPPDEISIGKWAGSPRRPPR